MEAKQYLRMVRRAVERLPILRQKKQAALDQATAGVAGGSGGVRSSNISNIPEAYAIQVDRYSDDIRRSERLIREASALIAQVKNPTSQDILDLYYIEAEPWWAVADAIDRTYNYTCTQLHGIALNDFRKVYQNRC